jgi:hypothetical protein
MTGAPIRFAGAIFWVRFPIRGAEITPIQIKGVEPLKFAFTRRSKWQSQRQTMRGRFSARNSMLFNGLPQ